MTLPDLDTSVGHSFGLEVDGIVIKQITEVSGLKMEQDVIELKQNTADGKYVIKKLPGRPKAGEVTLTRGLTGDKAGIREFLDKFDVSVLLYLDHTKRETWDSID